MKSKILFLIGVAFLYLASATNAQRPSFTRPDSIKSIPFGVKLPSPLAAMELIPKEKRIPYNPMQANGGKQMSADKSPASVPYSGVDHLAEQYKKYIESKKPADNPLPSLSANRSVQQSRPTQNGQVANFHLTADINKATPNSYPSNYKFGYEQQSFAVLNGVSYFAADDGVHGRELWRSDGTTTGTYMVKDIIPGGAGSNVENITAIEGLLYFSAYTDESGQEPWVSNGTEVGTKMLLDINSGIGSSYPVEFLKVNNSIIFSTESNYTEGQIWKTNGTSAGTVFVYDFNKGDSYSGYVSEAVSINGLYFFSAFTIAHGRELWRSDGTEAGTFLVKDIGPDQSDYFSPLQLTAYNNKLYFSGDDGSGRVLWVSDGTNAGTAPVINNNNVFTQNDYTNYNYNMPFAVLGNILYLAGYTTADGSGLYKYDASSNTGITLVKDLTSGGEVDFITAPELRVVGNSLYFKVINSIGGYHDELWISQGEPGNTHLVKEWAPGNVTTNYYNISGKLYFVEDDPGFGVYGPELWTTDGTEQGTRLVKDIYKGRQGSFPYFITSFKGKVLFSAIGQIAGAELWLSDGTTDGTVLVKDINAAFTFSSDAGTFYKGIVSLGNKVVFGAFEPEHGGELYVSDGSKPGTKLLNDINPGPDWSYPYNFLAKKDAAYFQAYSSTGPALFKTDGTSAGLKKIIDINSNGYFSNYAVADNGIVFYVLYSYNTGNYELWRSDGTTAGTYLLSQNVYYNNSLVTAGNTAFFVARDNDHGDELWKSDGSVKGTKMVTDIFPGVNGSTPYSLFAFKNNVYFGAIDNPNYSNSFWKSNGNVTIKLKEVFPDFSLNGYYYNGNNPYCISGNELYFAAYDQNYDNELYKTEGAPGNTKLVKDINPFYSSSPANLTDVNGEVFFTADDGVNGNELWASNGTAAGTKLIKDITPGVASSFLDDLCSVGDRLYFLDFTHAYIWSSDGTEAGTNIVDDPGLVGVFNFNNLTPADNQLFFSANSYLYGAELYVGDAGAKTFTTARASSSDNIAEVKLNTTFDAMLYPNPVRDNAVLQLSGNTKNLTVSIADISGKILWHKSFANQSKINLPVEKLGVGSYLLTLKTDTENKTIKFVKQ